MESKNAQFLKDGVIEQSRKMEPLQRVRAFIRHSEALNRIRLAGEKRRQAELAERPRSPEK